LDTGATHSAVTAAVATALNLTPDTSSNVILRGVTGSAVVPTIRVDTLHAGDLLLAGKRLPIITDALGGSEGILGTEGLADKRIYINFRHDLIRITRSHGERADPDFITVPVNFGRGKLLMVDSRMRLIRLKAIIGTGGQVSIANLTARDALAKRLKGTPTVDNITGATADVQEGESHIAPMMEMSDIQIRSSHIAFGDTQIFKQWKMTDEPAVLIGMDVLGLLDTLVIDYQRAELQMKRRTGW
ncbi:MAG: aspartyl protease family protein, partial [Steroidobacteraceae bacterium]